MKGLLTSLITVLTFTGLQAQSLPTAPKLVVGLTIDQLRTDYLEAFSSLYGERGFKRLWKEGRVFHNAEYTFSGVDRASAMAAIYSGSTPSVNGIISNRWMDVATLRPVNSTDDAAFMGYYTDQTCAPTKLLTSTIADELKIATQGKGIVYAIAPFCDAAIPFKPNNNVERSDTISSVPSHRLITGISCGSFNPQVRGLIFAVDKFLSVSEKFIFVVGKFLYAISDMLHMSVGIQRMISFCFFCTSLM